MQTMVMMRGMLNRSSVSSGGPWPPQLHVTDSHLARRGEGVYGREQVPGYLSLNSHSCRSSAEGMVGPRAPPYYPLSHPPVC